MDVIIEIIVVMFLIWACIEVFIVESQDLKEYDPKAMRKELIKLHKTINEIKRGKHTSSRCTGIKGEDK